MNNNKRSMIVKVNSRPRINLIISFLGLVRCANLRTIRQFIFHFSSENGIINEMKIYTIGLM